MSSAGGTLTHLVQGSGEPVLLLNGGLMTFASWEPVAARLRGHYQVILCDLRGQLRSPGRSHAALQGHVEDLERLLDELEISKVHLLGTSFGAEVGLLMAATRPERVRSLIAATATDRATEAMRREAAELRRLVAEIHEGGDRGVLHDRLVEGVYSAAYVESHREDLAARRRQIARLPDIWFEGLEGILACTEALDLRSCLSAIRCPTLVVIAAGDRVMPAERSRAMAAAIAGARVVEHATSGHALVAEDPEWLAERCLEFLGRSADV